MYPVYISKWISMDRAAFQDCGQVVYLHLPQRREYLLLPQRRVYLLLPQHGEYLHLLGSILLGGECTPDPGSGLS